VIAGDGTTSEHIVVYCNNIAMFYSVISLCCNFVISPSKAPLPVSTEHRLLALLMLAFKLLGLRLAADALHLNVGNSGLYKSIIFQQHCIQHRNKT